MKKGLINILLYVFGVSFLCIILSRYINSNITYFIFTTIPYLLLSMYYIFIYKEELVNSIKKINKKDILWLFGIEIIGFLLMMLANYVLNYIIMPDNISNNEAINRELLFNHKITYFILLCFIVPFLEEISFRLEFKKSIKNKCVFIVLSSFLFSIIHILASTSLIELLYIIPYFILGVTFSTIYVKTDNILCNTLAHMLHNTVTVLLILLF